MSAVIAVLVVLAAALVAGLSTQVSQGQENYAAEQSNDVTPSDETAPEDKPEPKRSLGLGAANRLMALGTAPSLDAERGGSLK